MNHAIVNRITSVKHALGEYAWLYGQCEDNLSKCTLAGLLNYWISMEYRHVKDVADHRYKAYADWDILDMEEFSQAVFLGAEQADSIQAVVDYNYDLLIEAGMIEFYAVNPYEAFVMMCVVSEDLLDTFAGVWEKSYDEE